MNKHVSILILIVLYSLNVHSQNVDSLIQKGNELRGKGFQELAICEYQKVIEINRLSPIANYALAYTYLTLSDYKRTIKYCDRVIRSESEKTLEAYMLKGSALDYLGKQKKSIRLFKKALRIYPDNYLLHYNLGISYHNMNKYIEAEVQYIRAIEIDKLQPSSHFMLGVLMNDREYRVRSMLSLYFFLLLEPNTSRSVEAYKLLQNQWKQNVDVDTIKTNSLKITSNPKENNTKLNSIDLDISSISARNRLNYYRKENENELFIRNTASLLSIMGNYYSSIDNDLYWNLYLKFYNDLETADQAETFSYYISTNCDDALVNSWLVSNKKKIEFFSQWVNERLK